MSVIIRLQNLPWSANALDIRQFFNGLNIPEGGVHIVGGELGDAFIAFSTDEDARQAFNLNGGKIKEVQVKLMLSSRTEMQKVIEAARNPLAAFMQAGPTQPISTLMPASIPAIISEIKKDDSDKEKRDRRRSRSRSRDRKERSRDRDRRDKRHRDRSRSRSRDRRDRRRRDRSRSRDRRSRDRDRRSKDRSRHSEDKTGSSSGSSAGNPKEGSKIGIWEDPIRNNPAAPVLQQAQALLNSFMPNTLDDARRSLNTLAPNALLLANSNGFPGNQNQTFNIGRGGRNTWGGNTRGGMGQFGNNQTGGRFGRGGIGQRSDGRATRFEPPSDTKPSLLERPGLLERPALLERPDNVKNCCVQLRPFYGGYGEIRRFFQGIFIHNTGIKFVNDENGKRTGIVYIRFATLDGKAEALQRNGGLLKQQNVEVIHLDDGIFDTTIDRFQPDHDRNDHSPDRAFKGRIFKRPTSNYSCLTIEDLPLFTKEQDMLKIFSDFPLQQIFLVNKQRQVVAYIKFTNQNDAETALNQKAKLIFDGKPMNIRPCSNEEYRQVCSDNMDEDDDSEHHHRNEDDEHEDEQDEDEPHFIISTCVSLSGLPMKTTDRDISDFFSDVAIVPNKIHLVTTNLGFTGQAYCEFASRDDAEIALEKDGLPLGSGTVSVKSISLNEMEIALGITSPPRSHPVPGPVPIRPFFPRGFGRGGHSHMPRAMGLMGHRPPMRRFAPPPPLNPTDMTNPGCTVLMENVPYKAGLEEILDFFKGFEIIPDNVLRRYNDNGTPSGEAKVIFNTKEDAYRALQERHMRKIRDRTVFLSQC